MNHKKVKTIDLDAFKTFYDPSSGEPGVFIPFPNEVKRIADELDGQTLPLREAVRRIQEVTSGEVNIHCGETMNVILLVMKTDDGIRWCRHTFSVIHFM